MDLLRAFLLLLLILIALILPHRSIAFPNVTVKQRGKGRGSVSKLNNFDPISGIGDDEPPLLPFSNSSPLPTNDPDMIDLSAGAPRSAQPFAIVMPPGLKLPTASAPQANRSPPSPKKTPLSIEDLKVNISQLGIRGGSETLDGAMFNVKMPANLTPVVSSTPNPTTPAMAVTPIETGAIDSREESLVEPTNEDYEKLAHLLQRFVNRQRGRRPQPPQAPFPNGPRGGLLQPFDPVPMPTTEPTTTTSPTSSTPLSISTTTATLITLWRTAERSESSRTVTSTPSLTTTSPTPTPTTWSGSIERVRHRLSHHRLSPSKSNLGGGMLGPISVHPSQSIGTATHMSTPNAAPGSMELVSLTWEKKGGRNTPRASSTAMEEEEKDDALLEQKFRQMSRELSSMLHKMREDGENGAQLVSENLDPPASTVRQISPKHREVQDPSDQLSLMEGRQAGKAYVTILREGLARQTDTNEYSFVASITLIRDSGKVILVDTGLATDINGRTDLIKKLSKLSIAPPGVDYVVTTHGHADHAGNVGVFLDSTHFQGSISHRRTRFNFTELFEESEMRLTPNVWLWRTPGHTADDITVLVRNTDKYGTMAVSGDVFMAEEDLDYPMMWRPLAWDEHQQEESRRRLLCAADYIVPGHGKAFKVTSTLRARVHPPCSP